jgi:hypothetical protein
MSKGSTSYTDKKKAAFLTAFRYEGHTTHGNISKSVKAAGVTRDCHYKWLKNDPQYKSDFEDAQEEIIEHLESKARERAAEKSDLLLIFLLKSLKPKVYGDRKEVTHKGKIDVDAKREAIFKKILAIAKPEAEETVN